VQFRLIRPAAKFAIDDKSFPKTFSARSESLVTGHHNHATCRECARNQEGRELSHHYPLGALLQEQYSSLPKSGKDRACDEGQQKQKILKRPRALSKVGCQHHFFSSERQETRAGK
jgi:hypothetical protein